MVGTAFGRKDFCCSDPGWWGRRLVGRILVIVEKISIDVEAIISFPHLLSQIAPAVAIQKHFNLPFKIPLHHPSTSSLFYLFYYFSSSKKGVTTAIQNLGLATAPMAFAAMQSTAFMCENKQRASPGTCNAANVPGESAQCHWDGSACVNVNSPANYTGTFMTVIFSNVIAGAACLYLLKLDLKKGRKLTLA